MVVVVCLVDAGPGAKFVMFKFNIQISTYTLNVNFALDKTAPSTLAQ